MPTNTLAAQVPVLACNTQGGPVKSIRPTSSLGSYGRTSVTIRHNVSRALVLICAVAFGPLAHSQPTPGGIVTRKIPFTILLSDSAGNLYFTGSVSPDQITPSPGAPQPQPGGGTCIASPRPFLPRPCNDAFIERVDDLDGGAGTGDALGKIAAAFRCCRHRLKARAVVFPLSCVLLVPEEEQLI